MTCYVCGRNGTRGFRWIPEAVVAGTHDGQPWSTTVGGWWECKAKTSCWRRFDRLRPRTCDDVA